MSPSICRPFYPLQSLVFYYFISISTSRSRGIRDKGDRVPGGFRSGAQTKDRTRKHGEKRQEDNMVTWERERERDREREKADK